MAALQDSGPAATDALWARMRRRNLAVVRRFGARLAIIAVLLPWTGRHVLLAGFILASVWAAVAATRAIALRQRLRGALNYWDEALWFAALALLSLVVAA